MKREVNALKILEKDKKKGILEVQIEDPEDLYFIVLILRKGDLIYAWTLRQEKISRVSGEERGERVRAYIGIKLEAIEFQRFTYRLRLRGRIVEAPEFLHAKGEYHTLSIGVGDAVKIVKEEGISAFEEKIVDFSSRFRAKYLILSLDLEEIALGILRPQGLELVVRNSLPRVRSYKENESIREHAKLVFEKAADILTKHVERFGKVEGLIILTTPLLARWVHEDFMPLLKSIKMREVKLLTVSEGGLAGIYEALRGDELRKIAKNLRLLEETKIVQELVQQLSRDAKNIAIGPAEVSKAVEWGVAKALIVLDKLLFKDEKIHRTVRKAAASGIDFKIISGESEQGRILEGLGGIAAFLYYPLEGYG